MAFPWLWVDLFALCFTAFGSVSQGFPLLFNQGMWFDMLAASEASAIQKSDGFIQWCLMGHLGCLHLVVAALCVVAVRFRQRERLRTHALLLGYNAPAIAYHYHMWHVSEGRATTWFQDPRTFSINVGLVTMSSVVNLAGVVAASMQAESEAGEEVQKKRK